MKGQGGIKMMSFESAFEMACWITSNITDLLLQEKLMFEGVRNKELKQYEGKYTIFVPKVVFLS